jgi:hypothetical protein
MAKLNEETLEIKISEILRDNEDTTHIVDSDTLQSLIAVIEQLVGEKRLVEINIK